MWEQACNPERYAEPFSSVDCGVLRQSSLPPGTSAAASALDPIAVSGGDHSENSPAATEEEAVLPTDQEEAVLSMEQEEAFLSADQEGAVLPTDLSAG